MLFRKRCVNLIGQVMKRVMVSRDLHQLVVFTELGQ